jgi:hypothetical protein
MDSESTNCELVWPDTQIRSVFNDFFLPLFTSVTSTFCLYLASFLSERVFTATAVHLFLHLVAVIDRSMAFFQLLRRAWVHSACGQFVASKWFSNKSYVVLVILHYLLYSRFHRFKIVSLAHC